MRYRLRSLLFLLNPCTTGDCVQLVEICGLEGRAGAHAERFQLDVAELFAAVAE